MNRKGQLGQIITSFPVLLLVLVIMVLFVIVAGFISAFGGVEESVSVHGIEEINSKILLEMFLGDYVLVDGKKEKIEEVLKENEIENFGELIQRKFHEKYGCDKNNILQLYDVEYVNEGGGQGVTNKKFFIYLNYPQTLNNLEKKITIKHNSIFSEGASEKQLENGLKIVAKGNIKC